MNVLDIEILEGGEAGELGGDASPLPPSPVDETLEDPSCCGVGGGKALR